MDCWNETMQDDCYPIAGDSWHDAAQPKLIIADKANKTWTRPDFSIGKKKYGQLTDDEIKSLVVDDKWMATVAATVQDGLDRISQTLTGRIRQLADRYSSPLPQLTDEIAALAARVKEHLEKMGIATN